MFILSCLFNVRLYSNDISTTIFLMRQMFEYLRLLTASPVPTTVFTFGRGMTPVEMNQSER